MNTGKLSLCIIAILSCFKVIAAMPVSEQITGFEDNCKLSYPHTNGFFDNENILVLRYFDDGTFGLIKINTSTGSKDILCKDITDQIYYDIAADADKIALCIGNKLYLSETTSINARKQIWDKDADGSFLPSISKDGESAAFYWKKDGISHIDKIDLQTLESETIISSEMLIGHVQISKYDSDWIGFCHEGKTEIIPDRVWAYNKELAPEGKCIFDQKSNIADKLLCVGHEVWAGNDLSVYAIAYGVSPAGPRGLWQVFPNGDKPKLISEINNAWHCDISQDGKWALVDCQGKCVESGDYDWGVSEYSDILLVNTETGQRTHIARSIGYADPHPQRIHHFHPHPRFSPDGNWVYYNKADSRHGLRNSIWRVNISEIIR